MSNNNGIYVEALDLPTTFYCNYFDEKVIGTTDGPILHNQGLTDLGSTSQVLLNESLPNDIDTQNQVNSNSFYYGAESLLNWQLIFAKELKSPVDIRYKTDYFPLTGKNAGVPQSPRYLHTVDGQQEITVKFPNGYISPPNPGDYWLEGALLTVPTANQFYKHVNKFQLNHTDASVLDENPFFTRLTQQNFDEGEIKVKLVLIKTHQNELKNITSLPLFGDQMASCEIVNCKSVDALKETYRLNRAVIAFSLCYLNTNGEFIRFPNTTVISNEIIEKEKPKPIDNVTCPNCSHSFSVQEQKEKGRKRSASASNSTIKKRSSKQ